MTFVFRPQNITNNITDSAANLFWLRDNKISHYIKLYNDQFNVQVLKFILFIYLLLPYKFRVFF
jgi:hypothetical protein